MRRVSVIKRNYFGKITETVEGYFHCFSTMWKEFMVENQYAVGQYPVAIIELEDGSLVDVPIFNVRFLSTATNQEGERR